MYVTDLDNNLFLFLFLLCFVLLFYFVLFLWASFRDIGDGGRGCVFYILSFFFSNVLLRFHVCKFVNAHRICK